MKTLELEVFRAGDHGERGVWSEETLDQIAADYSAALHEAPVTIDHAQTGPALGWVESVRRVGDVLVAKLRDLAPAFAEMLRAGAYKKRSVELYTALRETGRPYLRAVSFLGACPPQVKGLRDVVFAESESEPVTVAFTEEERTPWAAMRETLKSDGRWLPAWEEQGVEAFWEGLATEAQRAWFGEFLKGLPSAVPTAPLPQTIESPPAGDDLLPTPSARGEVSQASVALHRRAIAFRETHPGITYAEALRAIARA